MSILKQNGSQLKLQIILLLANPYISIVPPVNWIITTLEMIVVHTVAEKHWQEKYENDQNVFT